MTYTTAQGRQQLLDTVADAADQIGVALAALGEAYEELDEYAGDRLEEQLFRPVQAAYGRIKRTHAEFAARHGLPPREFAQQPAGVRPHDSRAAIDHAVELVVRADTELATLQDSLLPVEVGDPQLRAGLAEVRTLVGQVAGRAHELERTLGR